MSRKSPEDAYAWGQKDYSKSGGTACPPSGIGISQYDVGAGGPEIPRGSTPQHFLPRRPTQLRFDTCQAVKARSQRAEPSASSHRG